MTFPHRFHEKHATLEEARASKDKWLTEYPPAGYGTTISITPPETFYKNILNTSSKYWVHGTIYSAD